MLIRTLFAASLLFAAVPLFSQDQNGSVSGSVLDSQTGRPIAGAKIAINGTVSDQNVSDSDGRFLIKLSAGTYALRYTAPNYHEVVINDVVVKAGESTEASTVMANEGSVTSVDVVEKVDAVAATAEAMLNERKLSATVSDSISREELSAGASSTAAGALEKVTGVSVVGDGFVYVRGLGERYSATMLNSAMIPTTEPEKRVIPLDLFPTGLIENIKILKTYTPDLPAEFAGGLVQMSTVEFPAQKMLKFSTKTGFNTKTTFSRFLGYPGGGTDFFGFDDGTRSLPSLIPRDGRVIQGTYTRDELQQFGLAFSDNWQATPTSSIRPALNWSAVGGATFGKFGIVGAFSFDNTPQYQNEMQRYYRQGGEGPIIFTDYPDFQDYSEHARLGGVLNLAYRISPNNKLVLRNTLTHDTEKTAREFTGLSGGPGTVLTSERLRWIERSLLSTGLEGDHSIPSWHNSLFRWQFTFSKATRSEPDLREVLRSVLDNGTTPYAPFSDSGIRFFSDLDDKIFEPQVDYSVPFFKGKVSGLFKTGFRATLRRRDFQARRFYYNPQQQSTLNFLLPSNELFAPANIRPTGFVLNEYTRGTDTYDASMDVYGGYSMVDLALGSRWRIVGGIRFEGANIQVNTIDNRVPNSVPVIATLQNTDPAPGVNVIYALTGKQNFRISYSRTISRPDFRELSPFDFTNVVGGFVTQGNADLQRATINNYDVRWELFPGGNQVIAASFFAKTFNQPIEQTILAANDLRQSFINAKGAKNFGFELEFRKALGSYWSKARDFSVSSNFTFVNSNIEIKPQDATILTSSSRPLVGQSRYIFNGIVEWAKPKLRSDARFYVNYVARRISDVGTFRLPDIYQEANTFLDFVYDVSLTENRKWSLRFEAENLGDNDFRWTQGGLPQRQYQLGRTFQVGLNYALF